MDGKNIILIGGGQVRCHRVLPKISMLFIVIILLTAACAHSPGTGSDAKEKLDDQLSPAEIEGLYRKLKQATPGEVEDLIKSAEQGDVEAQGELGLRYDIGLNVKQDSAEAVKWYKKAAEQGDVLVQYLLGCIYHNGEGVTQNYTESAKWLCKAAEQGHVEAQFKVAELYALGQGVVQDHAEMAKWLRKAAVQGHAGAQYNLGQYCKIEKNYKEALKWYTKAAEQGYAIAQPMLGSMYFLGEGVAKDYVQAYFWFNLAANGPKGEDQKKAAEILELLSEFMSAQQLEEAKRLVREWNPKQ